MSERRKPHQLQSGIALRPAIQYGSQMHAVAETSIFSRRADALLTRDERDRLVNSIAADPEQGDLVPGLGGVRKMRFAAGGQGKRSAFRVIYFLASTDQPILALLIYGKNEQANPSADQRRAMLAAVETIKARSKRRPE